MAVPRLVVSVGVDHGVEINLRAAAVGVMSGLAALPAWEFMWGAR
ncbi:MAG TPA: hypothetical protein VGF32_19995 [Streptosporangiaceae bacterium]